LPFAAQGLVTSLVLVGAMIGAALGGALADRMGRRGGLWVCGIVFSVGVLFEANAFFIFGLVTFLSWLFTFGLLPETSGRTLDDIQAIWRERAATLFSHHGIRR